MPNEIRSSGIYLFFLNWWHLVIITFQLENGHTLFDYNVGLNEIVQILVRKKLTEPSPKKTSKKEENLTDKENVEVIHYDF